MTLVLQKSFDGSTGWTDIAGTTDAASFTIPSGDNGYFYRIKENKGGVVAFSAVVGPVTGGSGAPIMDQRAINVTAMSSTGAMVNPDGTPMHYGTVTTPPSPGTTGTSMVINDTVTATVNGISSPAAALQTLPTPITNPRTGEIMTVSAQSGARSALTLTMNRGNLGSPPTAMNAGDLIRPSDNVVVRSQTPANFWDGMIYTNDDVILLTDPEGRYGKIYRFRTNGNSRNPYFSDAQTCNTEVTKGRNLTSYRDPATGLPRAGGYTFDWWFMAIKWETIAQAPAGASNWNYVSTQDFHSCFQFWYPTIASPPFYIGAGYGDRLQCVTNTGLVTNSVAIDFNTYQLGPGAFSTTYAGKWIDFIVGARCGSHNDGELHVLMRCKANGDTDFTEVLTLTNINTWQWGGNYGSTNLTAAISNTATSASRTSGSVNDFPPSGAIKIDSEIIYYTGLTATAFTGLIRGQEGTTAASHAINATIQVRAPQDPLNLSVQDKLDSYWGYKAGVTDANAPTTYIQHTGQCLFSTQADALAFARPL